MWRVLWWALEGGTREAGVGPARVVPGRGTGQGHHISMGEIRRSFREEMISETSLREQIGFQWAAVGHCSQRNCMSNSVEKHWACLGPWCEVSFGSGVGGRARFH